MKPKKTVTTAHKWLQIPDDTLGIYNYWDCLSTRRVHSALLTEAEENGQLTHYRQVFWPTVPHYMAMAKAGLRLDPEALTTQRDRVRSELTETDAIFPPTLNPNSPKQRAELLYDQLGLPCGKTTPRGARSTDVHALEWTLRHLRKRDREAIPTLHALFHRSKLNTYLSRYLTLYPDPDGRLRPTIKMGRVETLRLAYSEPPIQQFPKELRNVVIPDPGNVFVALDYSQLEARIMAILAHDLPALAVFASGQDIHAANARDMFSYTLEMWEALDPVALRSTRDYSKSFIYGIGYGGKAETLKSKVYCPCPLCIDKVAPTLSLTQAKKKETEAAWYAKHPAVPLWRKQLVAQVSRDHSYTTAFGYRRFFFAPPSAILPEIYNNPMQGNAAGLVNERFRCLCEANLTPRIQMHDEVVLECPAREANSTAAQAKEIMEFPCPQLDNYSFPVSVKVGENWRDLEELKL